MDWTGWAIGLTVAGAVMELAGVVLAILEIRERGRRLAEYEQAIKTVRGFANGVLAFATLTASGVVGRSEPPTLEERVAAVESRMSQLSTEIENAKSGAIEEAERRARLHTESMAGLLRHEMADVRALLVGTERPQAGLPRRRAHRWWPDCAECGRGAGKRLTAMQGV